MQATQAPMALPHIHVQIPRPTYHSERFAGLHVADFDRRQLDRICGRA